MIDGKKIGLGLVTCDRYDYLIKSAFSLGEYGEILDYLVVVNDGKKLKSTKIPTKCFPNHDVIEHDMPYQGVAVSKNNVIRKCLENGCDYIFIMEDDMLIQSPDIFQAYITAMEESNIQHMNFAHHGKANYNGNIPIAKMTATYATSSVTFFQNLIGAFSVYTKDCLLSIGNFDETYFNAMEHVDHTYQASQLGFTSPFWWFADLTNSLDYIKEIEGSITNTTRVGDRRQNDINGIKYFEEKNGIHVSRVPNKTQSEVIEILKDFKG